MMTVDYIVMKFLVQQQDKIQQKQNEFKRRKKNPTKLKWQISLLFNGKWLRV